MRPAAFAAAPAGPWLVAMEGLDGTGKSRIGRLLARRLGVPLFHTPPRDYAPLRERLHGRRGPEGLLLYLAGCADAYHRAGRGRPPGLVADRFWFSSLAHHAWKNRAHPPRLDEALGWIGGLLPVPTLTVFLHAGREVRMARVRSRGRRSGREVVTPAQEAHWCEVSRAVQRLLPPGRTVRLDTSAITAGEAAGVVHQWLCDALRPAAQPAPLPRRTA